MQQKFRTELDSLGKVKVSTDNLWGAQTERALLHFQVGQELMPKEIIYALALIKKAAAKANTELGCLPKVKSDLIIKACNEILLGKLDAHFPLKIWQSGSATQTNMNLNEVITNRAILFAKVRVGSKQPIHPNDHVNMSQSTNDVFPTAMHVATTQLLHQKLFPAIVNLRKNLSVKKSAFNKFLKIGRTHLQDALPLTLGQEFSGYIAQLDICSKNLQAALPYLSELAIGGTAVGTGLNAHPKFGMKVAKHLTKFTSYKFTTGKNKFALLAAHDALNITSSALKNLATTIFKIANDIRWLASGPRCGLGELILPSNEPGSSIMPGKVNPTQCEMVLMVCTQIIGNDAAVSFANSQGDFELNIFKPVMIYNILQSINLLSEAILSFSKFAIQDLKVNKKRIDSNVANSLMMVTALNPIIGYDRAAKIAQLSFQEGISLKEACVKLCYLTAKEFDKLVNPKRLI